MTDDFRIEHDSMGEVRVPATALYGAQTQRAVTNFPISGLRLPRPLIRALGLIKAACAEANLDLELLDRDLAGAIIEAAAEVAEGEHDDHFPIDVFQTGSGTSTNMNANEVIARLASRRLGREVHPNDHVNLSQSSNDVFPSAIRVAASTAVFNRLTMALGYLERKIRARAEELDDVVKTGRTHLMDAMPIRMSQELAGWADQVLHGSQRLELLQPQLNQLPLGGTAVGTGINAPPSFGRLAAEHLSDRIHTAFRASENPCEGIAGQDVLVALSGQIRAVAVALMKISNDLRWMNSGPLAGLGEISLPPLQPGSSIMPGKINPVIPEAAAMVCAQVIGNDAAITVAGASGSFQLNVMLPLIAHNLLQSIDLLTNAARALADQAIAGFEVNRDRIEATLSRNPVLVTALTPIIGYERGAEIAKRAAAEGRPLKEVAREMTDLTGEQLDVYLDPARLTRGGRVK